MALTVKGIEKIHKPGRYLDGHGLYLQWFSPTNRSWIFRYEKNGKDRYLGLGPLHTINLADARERARKARQLLLDGVDPIEYKRASHDQKKKEQAENITFREATIQFLALHENGWRNAKHRLQWKNSLSQHAHPALGNRPVKAIDAALVNEALSDIWTSTPETARRVKLRIERILKWVREGKPLPRGSKKARTKNHPALPYSELPKFITELRSRKVQTARALEFLILTAARTGEVIGATWPEIDLQKRLWTVPAQRMKASKEHRVPLSDSAIKLLESLPREDGNPYVFVGANVGKPLSNMSMLEMLKHLRPGYVPHGFRSTFRDWAAECTNYANHIAEMCLAHVVQGVEASYRRGDLLEKRARLMMDWSNFCGAVPNEETVVPMLRAASQ